MSLARNSAGFSINSFDARLLAAAGRIDGVTSIYRRGVNPSVGTSFEDLRPMGISLTHMAAATTLEVASEAAADDLASTGARTVQVLGYDTNIVPIDETITMDGQTLVVTTGVFLGVDLVRMLTGGSGGVNAGNVFVADDSDTWAAGEPDTDSKVLVKVPTGYGQSQEGRYTVPAGFTGYITGVHVNATPGKTITFRLVANDLANAAEVVELEGIVPIAGYERDLPFIAVAEKTTVRLQAKVSGINSAPVSGGFEMILIDNSKV